MIFMGSLASPFFLFGVSMPKGGNGSSRLSVGFAWVGHKHICFYHFLRACVHLSFMC